MEVKTRPETSRWNLGVLLFPVYPERVSNSRPDFTTNERRVLGQIT